MKLPRKKRRKEGVSTKLKRVFVDHTARFVDTFNKLLSQPG